MTSLFGRERCQNPLKGKNLKLEAKHVDPPIASPRILDEPDREESPESPRNASVSANQSFGSFERRGTASWPSAAIDFNELAAVPTTAVTLPRSRLTSFESGSHGRAACESFDSTVTDFDYLTSPGAQAEMNAEYIDAVRSSLPRIPSDAASLFRDSAARPAFDMTGLTTNGNNSNSSSALQARAAELEFMAAQVMAQAFQAKAQALRMQSGNPPGQNASTALEQSTSKPSSSTPATSSSSTTRSNVERTTVMLRNLPNDYNRDMLVQLLNEQGFDGSFDFLYLPMDLKRRAGLGYAFVNLVTPAVAQRAFATLQGFSDWKGICSAKVLEVAWGDPLQGLEAHVNRYRNSPVMHEDAPAEFRPLLFHNGQQVDFPPPTRKLRAPRLDFRTH